MGNKVVVLEKVQRSLGVWPKGFIREREGKKLNSKYREECQLYDRLIRMWLTRSSIKYPWYLQKLDFSITIVTCIRLIYPRMDMVSANFDTVLRWPWTQHRLDTLWLAPLSGVSQFALQSALLHPRRQSKNKPKMLSQVLRRSLVRSSKTSKGSWSPLVNKQGGSLDVWFFTLSLCSCFIDTSLFLGLVAYKQPLLYNLAVTREIIKQVYVREGLQPPSLSAIQSAYASLWSQITSPGFVRNLIQSGQVGRVGVYGLQAYGIFKARSITCHSATLYVLNDSFFWYFRLEK